MASVREDERGRLSALGGWIEQHLEEVLPGLFGYFVVRVGGRADVAEDLTQETILAAVRAGPTAAPDEPRAWLFGTARHKLVDHYRREDRDRRQFAAGDPELVIVGTSAPIGDLDLESLPIREAIVSTLDRLPPRQRSAIVLRYFDDLDVATVATLLDLSLHATESLLARGRASFRRIYREHSGDQS